VGSAPLRDFSDVLPKALAQKAPDVTGVFENPPANQTHAAAIVLTDKGPVLPKNNALRTSDKNDGHAEDVTIKSGDLLEAAREAAQTGSPDHKAQVAMLITRSPCAGGRPEGQPESCTRQLQQAWPEVWGQLTEAEQANVEPTMQLLVRGPYAGKSIDVATTTKAIEALKEANIEMDVVRAGKMTKEQQALVDVLRDLRAKVPSTPANAMASFNGGLRVSGNYLNGVKVRAIAQAQRATSTDPDKLSTLDKTSQVLDKQLHQQGVCI
jgi:hypothetical protein